MCNFAAPEMCSLRPPPAADRFLPVLPRNSGFPASTDRARLGKRPGHSHSTVSGTCKRLNKNDFVSGRAKFTVKNAVSKSCLGAMDGDRCRKGRDDLPTLRREGGSMR